VREGIISQHFLLDNIDLIYKHRRGEREKERERKREREKERER